MKGDKRKQFYCSLSWILLGLLLVYSAFFTYLNDFRKISFSVDDNDVRELYSGFFVAVGVEGAHSEIQFSIKENHHIINYLRLNVADVETHPVEAEIAGGTIDEDGNFRSLWEIDKHKLKNGNNDYKINFKGTDSFRFVFDGATEQTIQRVELRESVRVLPLKQALFFSTAVAVVYSLLSALLFFVYRKVFSKDNQDNNRSDVSIKGNTDNSLAGSLCMSLNRFGLSLPSGLSSIIRTLVILLMVIASLYLEKSKYKYFDVFHYYFFLQVGLVLLLIFFSNDKKHHLNKLETDKSSLLVCGSLASYMLASDFLVDKPYRFAGIGIFVIFLILGVTWANMNQNTDYLKNFTWSTQIFLVILIALSFSENRDFSGYRYSGPIENPSVYALYLCTIWAVLLGLLENQLLYERSTTKEVLIIIELLVVVVLLLKAGSVTPMLAAFSVATMCLFRLVANKKGTSFALRLFIVLLFVLIIIGLLLIYYIRVSDFGYGNRFADKMDQNSISALLSGRDHYWREYLRKMNLFGHSKKPYHWHNRILPHNALIGMMYWYGVPSVIPYIVMMFMAVEKSWKFANTQQRYSTIPFYSIFSFIIMSMADNIEQPFVWLPWIACYLMMAPMLAAPMSDIVSQKKDA